MVRLSSGWRRCATSSTVPELDIVRSENLSSVRNTNESKWMT